jgi:hypothetical protein
MTRFKLAFKHTAYKQLEALKNNPSQDRIYKAICKTLGLLETNPRHPSLQTHEFHSIKGPHGEKIYEAYAQNRTPGAYRVFWMYGPDQGYITILSMEPHP